MSWASVQQRYELIRISEILQSWAKFRKNPIISRINEIRIILLNTKPSMADLFNFRDEFISIIINSNDPILLDDLREFVNSNQVDIKKEDKIGESSY